MGHPVFWSKITSKTKDFGKTKCFFFVLAPAFAGGTGGDDGGRRSEVMRVAPAACWSGIGARYARLRRSHAVLALRELLVIEILEAYGFVTSKRALSEDPLSVGRGLKIYQVTDKLLRVKAKLKKGLENELKARGLARAAGYD